MTIPVSLKLSNGKTIETQALIDSGAGGTFLDEKFAKQNKIPLIKLTKSIPVFNVDETPNKNGQITWKIEESLIVQGRTRETTLFATSLGKERIILGYPWLAKENPDIDWRKRTLIWRNNQSQNIYALFQKDGEDFEQETNAELVISFIQEELTDEAQETWMKTRMSHLQLFGLKEEKAKEKPVLEIVPTELHQFLTTVFSERELGRLLINQVHNHKIELKPDFEPKRGILYRIAPEDDQALKDFIKENEEKGYIRKSQSPQAAPFFFIPKKDRRQRPVQDYRYINSGTVKNYQESMILLW